MRCAIDRLHPLDTLMVAWYPPQTWYVLEAVMRRTLLPRMGYREGLTQIQLWLLNSLMQQTVFDI